MHDNWDDNHERMPADQWQRDLDAARRYDHNDRVRRAISAIKPKPKMGQAPMLDLSPRTIDQANQEDDPQG